MITTRVNAIPSWNSALAPDGGAASCRPPAGRQAVARASEHAQEDLAFVILEKCVKGQLRRAIRAGNGHTSAIRCGSESGSWSPNVKASLARGARLPVIRDQAARVRP